MFQRISFTVLFCVALLACTPEKRAIRYGEDECSYCRMLITDSRYGSELVTEKGKIYTFDSVECLAAHLLSKAVSKDKVQSVWVTDFENPTVLINAETAGYLLSSALKSPMGLNITAYNIITSAEFENRYNGQKMDWAGVKNLVNNKWLKEK